MRNLTVVIADDGGPVADESPEDAASRHVSHARRDGRQEKAREDAECSSGEDHRPN